MGGVNKKIGNPEGCERKTFSDVDEFFRSEFRQSLDKSVRIWV